MHVAVDPSQLILTGSPVAGDRMHMTVDQTWTESSSARVDDRRGVPDVILWEVDPQADFMLPDGKLYVPGAEKLLPNIRRLTDAARDGKVFLVSHGCFHTNDDPEFKMFPPHCVQGTPGANFVPEALT